MTRRFKGSSDPNAIVLEDLFPLAGIKISTELKDNHDFSGNGFQEFVFEGEEEHLRFIEKNSNPLHRAGWRLGDPLTSGDKELRIFKRLEGDFTELIEIPVFGGWHDLSDYFVLANRVRLSVLKQSILIFEMTCDLHPREFAQNLLRVQNMNKALLPEGNLQFN